MRAHGKEREEPRPGGRLRSVAIVLATAALLGFAGVVWKLGRGFAAQDLAVDAAPLLAAALLVFAYRYVNAGVWSAVLAALGARVSFRKSARIWLTAESLRWCPGAIWSYASRAALGAREGLSVRTVASSLPLELVLTVLAWTTVAALGFACSGETAATWLRAVPALPGWMRPATLCAACAGVAILVLALAWRSPRVRALAGELRALALREVRAGSALCAFASYTALCLFHGLVFFVVARAVVPEVPLWPAVGANAIAWVLGFFAFVAPGGIGVREAGVTLFLAPWMPLETGAFVALVWRLIQVAVEPVLLATALLLPAPLEQGRGAAP